MARTTKNPKSIKDIINNLMNKEIGDKDKLRSILENLEINVLRLTADEVDNIQKLLVNELKVSRKSDLELLESELLLATDEGIKLDEAKWRHIKKFRDLANKDLAPDSVYQLGHKDVSIYITYMQLLKKFYPLGQDEEASRQLTLINNTIAIAKKIDNLTDSELTKLQTISKKRVAKGVGNTELLKVIEMAGKEAQIDVTASSKLVNSLVIGTGRIEIELELKSKNVIKGNLTGLLSKQFIKHFGNRFADKKSGFESKLLETLDPINIKFSPSFKDRLDQTFDSLLLGKKLPKKIQKSKVRLSRRLTSRNTETKKLKSTIKRRIAGLKTLEIARRKKKKFIIPTVTLKAIINESLAQFVKNRMGKPTDPAVKLRYQSGRFSESAKLLTLNRTETGAFIGTYDFKKDPYATFLPGGRLSTQQRDPRLYIEGAIRDISVQVLKKQFKGISLELK